MCDRWRDGALSDRMPRLRRELGGKVVVRTCGSVGCGVAASGLARKTRYDWSVSSGSLATKLAARLFGRRIGSSEPVLSRIWLTEQDRFWSFRSSWLLGVFDRHRIV